MLLAGCGLPWRQHRVRVHGGWGCARRAGGNASAGMEVTRPQGWRSRVRRAGGQTLFACGKPSRLPHKKMLHPLLGWLGGGGRGNSPGC